MSSHRGPAAYVADARRLKDSGAEADWGLSALTEQTEAAFLVHRRRIESRGLTFARGSRQAPRADGDVYVTAFAMAVLAAGERRVSRHCPHVRRDRLIFYQPVHALLSLGVVTCEPCLPLVDRTVDPDDRCDLCDTPSRYFREFAMPLGACVVSLNACRICGDWMLDNIAPTKEARR